MTGGGGGHFNSAASDDCAESNKTIGPTTNDTTSNDGMIMMDNNDNNYNSSKRDENMTLLSIGSSEKNSSFSSTSSQQSDTFEDNREERKLRVKRRMNILTILAATGGFLFGYDTGVISGAMPPIHRALDLDTVQQETIVSCTVLFAFASSLFGSNLNTKLGRKYTILISSFVFTVGSLLMCVAWDYGSLVSGRCIVGIGIGLASLTTPMYIAEVAEPKMRGTLVTINGLLICLGQFVAGMIDGIFDSLFPDNGWRVMLGLAAVPSLVMFIGFKFLLPESPRWLVMNNHIDEAKEVLMSVRETDEEAIQELREIEQVCMVMNDSNQHQDDIDDEQSNLYDYDNDDLVFTIEDDGESDNVDGENGDLQLHNGSGLNFENDSNNMTYQQQWPSSNSNSNYQASSKNSATSFCKNASSMLKHAPTRRALILGCGMMVLQQLSGINTVMYYAASIYQMSGFSGEIFLYFIYSISIFMHIIYGQF